MGEISFNYNIDTEPVHEAGFRYRFSDSIEYSFAYQRYIAFSDASIFNSPVAITKVATGLYQYYDLFVDKKAYPTMYGNLIKHFDKVQHDTEDEDTFDSSYKVHRDINEVSESYRTERPYSSFMDVYSDVNTAGETKILYTQEDISMLRDRNAVNIYFSPIIRKVDSGKASIYGQQSQMIREMFMNIMESVQSMVTFEKHGNIYNSFMGTPFRISMNIYDDVYLNPFGLIGNINDWYVGKTYDNEFNVLKDISGAPFRISLNTLKTYFGKPSDLSLNIMQQIYLKYPYEIYANIIEQIFGKRPDFTMQVNSIIGVPGGDKKVHVENWFAGQPGDKQSIMNNIVSLKGSSKYAYSSTYFLHGYKYGSGLDSFYNMTAEKISQSGGGIDSIRTALRINHEAFYESQYSVYLYEKPLCVFDLDNFAVSEQKYCFTVENTTVTANYKDLSSLSNMYQCTKVDKGLFIKDFYALNTAGKDLMTTDGIHVDKQDKHLGRFNSPAFTFKDGRLLQTNNLLSVNKEDKSASFLYAEYFINKEEQSVSYDTQVFIGKFKKSMVIKQDEWVDKDRKSFETLPDILGVDKDRASMVIQDMGTGAYKDGYLMDSESFNFLSAYKDGLSMVLYDATSVYKDMQYMSLCASLWGTKSGYNASLFEQYTAEKDAHLVSVFNQIQSFIKDSAYVSTLDFDEVIKNRIPADYTNSLFNGYAGMIIPISKVRHQGYIDSIDEMVKKLPHNGYIGYDTTATIIPKNTYVQPLDLFCDKASFKTYIDYKNNQVTKAQIHVAINKSVTYEKTPIYCHLEAPMWADKTPMGILSHKDLWAEKMANNGLLEGNLFITKGSQELYRQESLFVDKNDQMCYYDYDMTWADKELKVQMNAQFFVDREQQKGHMLDCISPAIKSELHAFYDYGIFLNKFIHESGLFKQLHDVHKIAKDTGIHPDDFGNWAWVYETPDPFEGLNFGIDELLLPENDTRYEDFESLIFDKENMRPKNPVKVIDDHTFIAKLPTKHPLPKYKDVAIDYERSAVKLDQFYGIETRIMHTVFLKFYRIWQSKIFEFGTMTMVQSVKLMLEYMYSWIMEYFPVTEVEQALRVFRLIRWYGETSIIQNSQYIITYEYATLESKLNTGTCMVPNDLGPANDTMYVDAALGVIRNHPSYIGSLDASVQFFIDNKKNTTFTFSLSNTVGSVNIYINDVLIDIVSSSALNLTYELPYTGDTNVVKIEKLASHNLNATFFIGNIKVPNCSFKDLSIEFDPTLKAGNKPLNEIAMKMISYANLYEDKEEAYEIIRKGNLGVGEIYKRLTEYWELHHQDKLKGKRLTIKEV